MTLDEIRKLAERAIQPPSRDGGPNPTPDLARFAIAVLDALNDERAYASQVLEINRGQPNAIEWAGRCTGIDAVLSATNRNMERLK